MDISTIKVKKWNKFLTKFQKKIKNNKYATTKEVLADLQLIWDNCKLYNIDGSVININIMTNFDFDFDINFIF